MALRLGLLKSFTAAATEGNNVAALGFMRWAHVASMSAPLDACINFTSSSPPSVLPESDNLDSENGRIGFGFGFPGLTFGGSMEVMAVPKKKVSRHKRGIRNGPKALKPTPVIIRCRSCGRVKLPHFYCCSGERGNIGEKEN